ncbi:hypothetical protein ACJJTC_016500, partial [Scirpophaga incertulas]
MAPALRKLVEYLAAVYPQRCSWCLQWFDELYLVFDCCLQYHYLKYYAASFSESFYGLLRVPVSLSSEFASSHHRLPDLLEKGSLALLVLVPYFRDKLDKVIDKWREDVEDGIIGKSTSDSLRRAAVKIYAITHFCYQVGSLVQTARYMRGTSQSHSPLLAALGLTLKEAPPHFEDEEHSWTELAKSILTGQIGRAGLSFPMIGGALLRAIEYGAFLVQFLRWWDGTHSASSAPLPVPPPPPKGENEKRLQNKCPICLRTWRIPTVLPVSG